MKNIFPILLIQSLTCGLWAQNINWETAPMNPAPRGMDLKKELLKSDVLQANILDYYTASGQWFSFDGEQTLNKDSKGRVISLKDSKNHYEYEYDPKGNLIHQKLNGKPDFTYGYDAENRLALTIYENEKSSIEKIVNSYSQNGSLCIVKELVTYRNGTLQEREKHFEKGLETYSHSKGYPAIVYKYEYDKKGNWISRIQIDAATQKPALSSYDGKPIPPFKRDIIYHSDYSKGLTSLEVILDNINKENTLGTLLVPRIYISGTELKRQLFTRFLEDYIFYDPLLQTYYIARNAYSKTHSDGQKITVEKLLAGHKNILLFDGAKFRVVEKGVGGTVTDWKGVNYYDALKCFVATNEKEKKMYGFGNIPTISEKRTIAVAGKNIAGISYLPTKEKSDVHLFHNGAYIKGNRDLIGYIDQSKTLDLVVTVENEKYVLPGFEGAVELDFNPGRIFNATQDSFIHRDNYKKQPSITTAPETENKQKKIDLNAITLSTEARTLLESFNSDPEKVADHVTEVGRSIAKMGVEPYPKFLEIIIEVYQVDRFAAFKMLLVATKEATNYALKNMPKDMRDALRAMAVEYKKEKNQMN